MKTLNQIIIGLTIASVILATTFIGNHAFSRETPQELAAKPYKDPKGFFMIFPPKGWGVKEFPKDPRGKVHFIKSKYSNIMILTKPLTHNSFDEFYEYCNNEGNKKLNSVGVKNLSTEKTWYGDYPVVKRVFKAQGSKAIMIDFFIDGINHNLFFSVPTGKFDECATLAELSMKSYMPKRKNLTDSEIKTHQIKSRIRVSELLIETGKYNEAFPYIEEGLSMDMNDSTLLAMKEVILKRGHKQTELEDSKDNGEEGDSNGGFLSILGGLFAVAMYFLFFKRLFGR